MTPKSLTNTFVIKKYMTSNTCINKLVRRTSWTCNLRSQELSSSVLSSQKIESRRLETLPERKRVNEATLPRRALTADDADLSQKNGRAKLRRSTKHPNTSYSVLGSICSCLHLFLEWCISTIIHVERFYSEFNELEVQSVEATASDLFRAASHRFEPRSLPDTFINILYLLVYQKFAVLFILLVPFKE